MLAHTEVNVWPLRSNTDWVLEPDCAAITGKWQHFHSITEPIIIKVIDDTEREREGPESGALRHFCCHLYHVVISGSEVDRDEPEREEVTGTHWSNAIERKIGLSSWFKIKPKTASLQTNNPPLNSRPGDTNIKVQDIIWASCKQREWFWLRETEIAN